MRNVRPVAEQFSCDGNGLTHELITVRQDLEGLADSVDSDKLLGELAATIEGEIIPRLLINLGVENGKGDDTADFQVVIDAETLDAFVRLAMGSDAAAASDMVASLRARGVAKDTILLDLFGPAARMMGEMWSADLCSFVDVTLGLARLQAMMRALGGLVPPVIGEEGVKGRVLLVPAPGEQHTLGLRVVEEFLLRDGWAVSTNMTADVSAIASEVAAEWYEFAGLSASNETLIVELAEAISVIRKKSLNPGIKILVGGVLFAIRPGLGAVLGADGCCTDPREALLLASPWARNGNAPRLHLS